MKGKVIGYIRVSSFEQNPERQLEGCEIDKVFTDHCSGKDIQRPQLKALLKYVREGDTVVIHSLDRLARNLDDLRKLVQQLNQQDIKVKFLKENLVFTGEDSPMSNLLLSVMGAFAEFERSLIRERQLEGVAIAKKKGLYRGRKRILNADQVQDLLQRIKSHQKKNEIAKELNISRGTLYLYLKQYSAAST